MCATGRGRTGTGSRTQISQLTSIQGGAPHQREGLLGLIRLGHQLAVLEAVPQEAGCFERTSFPEAFQKSVNLVFIRLMRDLVSYHTFREAGVSPTILEDENDPARSRYLSRFADWEGKEFLGRFWKRYAGKTPDDALKSLVSRLQPTPRRLAVIYRSVRPEAGFHQFARFSDAYFGAGNLSKDALYELYREYGPEQFSLNVGVI